MSEFEHSLYADSQPGIPVNEQASQRLQQWRDMRQTDATDKLAQNIPPVNAQHEIQHLNQDESTSPQDKLRTAARIKEGYLSQLDSLAQLQDQLKSMLDNDPGMSPDELQLHAQQFGQEHGLNEFQMQAVDRVVSGVNKYRGWVEKAATSFPNTESMYEYFFKRPPIGKIEVERSHIALHLVCHEPEDMYHILSQGWKEGASDFAYSKEEVDAFASSLTLGFSIAGLPIVVERGGVSSELMAPIQAHEERHVLNKIIQKSWLDAQLNNELQQLLSELTSERDKAKALALSKQMLLLARRRSIDTRAQDEIIAHFTGQVQSAAKIASKLTRRDHPSYGYAQNMSNLIGERIEGIGSINPLVSTEEVSAMRDQVFVDDYQDSVKQAIGSVLALEEIGYSREESLAFLQNIELKDWAKTVRRLHRPISGGPRLTLSELAAKTNEEVFQDMEAPSFPSNNP